MEWRTGDMVDVCKEIGADGIVFTANSYVKKNGGFCMGAGAALRVYDYFPKTLAPSLARIIGYSGLYGVQPDYHFAGVTFNLKNDSSRLFYVFALQVKRHFAEPGDLDLTIESLNHLANWCDNNPNVRLVLNCPLIGLGGFAAKKEEVQQMVESILGRTNIVVTIYE